jgi:hypothetical protein
VGSDRTHGFPLTRSCDEAGDPAIWARSASGLRNTRCVDEMSHIPATVAAFPDLELHGLRAAVDLLIEDTRCRDHLAFF